MANFQCPVVKLKIKGHPNADRLEVAVVGGYECIVGKGEFKTGDKAIYIPEQAILKDELIEKMGLEGRLAGSKKNRVKAIKLRGILSQGLIAPMSFVEQDYPPGHDCQEELDIIKYEPAIPANMAGEVWAAGKERTIPYDVENIKKYPDILQAGESIVITEKLHGTWCMVGAMPVSLWDRENAPDGIVVASKGMAEAGLAIKSPIPAPLLSFRQKVKKVWLEFAKKIKLFFLPGLLGWNQGKEYGLPILSREEYTRLIDQEKAKTIEYYDRKIKRVRNKGRNEKNLYWRAEKSYEIGRKLQQTCKGLLDQGTPIFVLGEVYGAGVQDLDYGANSGADETLGFRVFDIYLGQPGQGCYLNDQELTEMCEATGLERVPVLYRGPFSMEVVKEHTSGEEAVSGRKRHLREGIVIRPQEERRDQELGRVQLKSVSEKYLFRKGKITEYN